MIRTQLNLIQGTPEWLAARAESDGTASEAPAMKGKSKYQARNDLMHQRATGLVKEVNSVTQAIFNKGHEAEASARSIAEEIIGEELSPVTYMIEIDGLKLIASLDGIDFEGAVIWEHKLWNEKLAEQVRAGQLDEHYTIQLDQELLASGAEKCLFMVSDGTKEKCVYMTYVSDASKEQALLDGWKQFKTDLANYVPPVIVEKVEAETIKALPVPSVVVRGEITASNLGEITPMFDQYLGEIKTELSTDQDFADAEANSKNCRDMATRIKALRANIIAQMVDVNAVDGVLSNYEEAFNKVGLRLEKAVKEQKETIKTNAVLKTRQAYMDHVQALEAEIAPTRLNLPMPDFAGSFKNVKSLDTMHSRLNDALASGKIAADAMARDIRAKVFWFKQNSMDYRFLFNDLQQIIYKDDEDFKLIVKTRISDCKAEFEAKEAKIKADAESALLAKQAAETVATNHIAQVEKMVEVKPSILPQAMQAEFGNIFTPAIVTTQYFAGATPTVNEIVTALAIAFKVDELQAHKYLIDADFTKWVAEKKAA